jgi:hypothetical protein
MTCGIHVGDIGTQFRVTVQDCNSTAINISDATETYIIFKKPDGSTVTKTATFLTDGSDGKIRYTAASGDLDTVGSWKIQSYIVTPSGSWHSEFETFKVLRNL